MTCRGPALSCESTPEPVSGSELSLPSPGVPDDLPQVSIRVAEVA